MATEQVFTIIIMEKNVKNEQKITWPHGDWRSNREAAVKDVRYFSAVVFPLVPADPAAPRVARHRCCCVPGVIKCVTQTTCEKTFRRKNMRHNREKCWARWRNGRKNHLIGKCKRTAERHGGQAGAAGAGAQWLETRQVWEIEVDRLKKKKS